MLECIPMLSHVTSIVLAFSSCRAGKTQRRSKKANPTYCDRLPRFKVSSQIPSTSPLNPLTTGAVMVDFILSEGKEVKGTSDNKQS